MQIVKIINVDLLQSTKKVYKGSLEITSSGSNSDTSIKLLTPPLGISVAVIYLTTPGNIYKGKKFS